MIGKIIGWLIGIVMLPFVLLLAIPAGFLKARRGANARLLYTREEQSLLAKAQQTINMQVDSMLKPDDDLLEIAQCIEGARIDFQQIKNQERFDMTFSEFIIPKINRCQVSSWNNVMEFYDISRLLSYSDTDSSDADMSWKNDLCNWLNRVMTIDIDDMTAEDMFRVCEGNYKVSSISGIQQLVLGGAQGGRNIKVIPECLYQLDSLKSLHVQRNELTELSESLRI